LTTLRTELTNGRKENGKEKQERWRDKMMTGSTSIDLAPNVKRLVYYAALGNFLHISKNLSVLKKVISDLGSESKLVTGDIQNLGDIILEIQKHQRLVEGAIPKLKDPAIEDEIKELEGNKRLATRFRAPRKSEVIYTEDRYFSGEGPCTLCTKVINQNYPCLLPYYWDNFLIWSNPSPIFDNHITFVREEHLPQNLSRQSVESMLNFLWLAPQYRIFYNGPEVGASVPKHQHFQGLANKLPIESLDLLFLKERDNISIGSVKNYPARVIVFQGKNYEVIAKMVESVGHKIDQDNRRNIQKGKTSTIIDLNALLTTTDNFIYRVFLFPRRRLNPETCTGINDKPATVELSGIMVTSKKDRYDSLNAAQVESMLDEISSSADDVRELIAGF